MNNIKLNHKSYLKNLNRQQTIQLKKTSLQNCFYIKQNQSDTNKKLLDSISIEMQKLLNNGNLKSHHIEKFIQKMKNSGIHPNHCEEFLMNMLTIIKHNTNSETKTNWFGCVNKTDTLKLFLNISSEKLQNFNKNNFQGVLDLNYKAHIFSIIGKVYNILEYHVKSENCYKQLLNYYDNLENNLVQIFKNKLIEQSNEISRYVCRTHNI